MKALHFIDGKWVEGNPLLLSAWDHATWLGGAVFDGARAFEGVTPDLDLHCQRIVRSAKALNLVSPIAAEEIQEILQDGIARFSKGTPLYLRPYLWAVDGWIEPNGTSTRMAISVVESPMPDPKKPTTVCFSRWRRPSPETAPTDAKAVCLYPQAGRAAAEAKARGFDDAIMLDPLGAVAEFTGANLW